MKGRSIPFPIIATGLFAGLFVSGCAKHADFLEIRDQLSTMTKTQEQEQKRMEAMQRRLESLERVREPEISQRPRNDDTGARLQKLEARLARMEDAQAAQAAALKSDLASADAMRQSKPAKSTFPLEPAPMVPGVPSITPTSAFNLAYNDYLNGKYDLAVTGFQRFIKDFPSTSLTPNAHYWLGESFYAQKDYVRAMQSFEHVVSEYPGQRKGTGSLVQTRSIGGRNGRFVAIQKIFETGD